LRFYVTGPVWAITGGAVNLQKAAQAVVKEYKGEFPRQVDELKRLPGLGIYTASAVACFAFDLQIPVVDTNIRKVIAHEFFEGILPDEKIIEQVALQILPKGKAYEWNQALMDYSALVLKEKKIPVPKQSHCSFVKSLLPRADHKSALGNKKYFSCRIVGLF